MKLVQIIIALFVFAFNTHGMNLRGAMCNSVGTLALPSRSLMTRAVAATASHNILKHDKKEDQVKPILEYSKPKRSPFEPIIPTIDLTKSANSPFDTTVAPSNLSAKKTEMPELKEDNKKQETTSPTHSPNSDSETDIWTSIKKDIKTFVQVDIACTLGFFVMVPVNVACIWIIDKADTALDHILGIPHRFFLQI